MTWQLDKAPGAMEVRLFWYTEGKGDRDMDIVDTVAISKLETQGESAFKIALPETPFSCSGKLISVVWALEFVAQPGDHSVMEKIVISPTREEVDLRNTGR